MEQLRSHGVVHGDIEPRHFYFAQCASPRLRSNRMCLLGFGDATIDPEGAKREFEYVRRLIGGWGWYWPE